MTAWSLLATAQVSHSIDYSSGTGAEQRLSATGLGQPSRQRVGHPWNQSRVRIRYELA